MPNQAELAHLFCRDFLPGLKVFGHEMTFDPQTRLGFGLSNQAQDGFITVQRLPSPMFADFAEEPMLNRIPFRSACGVMAHGDFQLKWISDLLLRAYFQARTRAPLLPPLSAKISNWETLE